MEEAFDLYATKYVKVEDGLHPASEPPRYYDYVIEERSPKDKTKAHWMSLNTAEWRNKRKHK